MSFFFVRAAALTLPVNSWKFFFGSEVAELFQKYASEESTDLNFDHLKLHLLNVGKKGWLVQHGSNGMKNELTFFVN